MDQKIGRLLEAFSMNANVYSTLTEDQVNYMVDNHSLVVFCRGHLRRIKFEPITKSRYKVYTEPAV